MGSSPAPGRASGASRARSPHRRVRGARHPAGPACRGPGAPRAARPAPRATPGRRAPRGPATQPGHQRCRHPGRRVPWAPDRLPAGDEDLSRQAADRDRCWSCRWCCPRPSLASDCCWRSAGKGSRAGPSPRFGLSIPFTTLAVVVAQVFVAAPFFVAATRAGLTEVDQRYLDAAATLRSSPSRTLFRGHASAGLSLAARRRRDDLGPRARRVRRHHHFRRKHAGRHPDDAAGGLPGAADGPGCRGRHVGADAGPVRRGAARHSAGDAAPPAGSAPLLDLRSR